MHNPRERRASDIGHSAWLSTLSCAAGELFADSGAVEFHRDYTPGDDVRTIDWQWCAKRDELRVRNSPSEPDRHTYLLLDCSRSMSIGEPQKFQVAREISAFVSWNVLRRMDRLHVLAFADGIVDELPPTRRHGAELVLRYLRSLVPHEGATDLARAVQSFTRRYQRPGPTIIVSDFLFAGGIRKPLDQLRERLYQPCLIQLVDPQEADPSLIGDCELFDVETEACWRGRITETISEQYHLLFASYIATCKAYCIASRVPYVKLSTHDSLRQWGGPVGQLIAGVRR